MGPSKKLKYIALGSVTTAILVPLAIKAVDTIPLTFNQGDVISASVFNQLLANVNNVVNGFSSGADIAGTWSCTTYSAQGSCTPA